MSYQDQNGGGGYPPPREQESRYPPPPGEEDERRAYHQRANSNVTLPSMSYESQYGQPTNGYSPGPQSNGYASGSGGYPPQDPYRQQAPGGYQQDYGRGGSQHMAFSQSAPRQRTAIACRYCRRRKVSRNILFNQFRHRVVNGSPCKALGSSQFILIFGQFSDYFADPLLRIRSKPGGPLRKLPAIPTRVYLHPGLLPSTSFRSCAHRISWHAKYANRR